MAKKPKRNPMEAIMPPAENTEELQNKSVNDTEELSNNSASKTPPRRRRPLKEKAVRQTYSLYPRIIKGVEKYADDYGMTYSQVVKMALTSVIPHEYFEDDEEDD